LTFELNIVDNFCDFKEDPSISNPFVKQLALSKADQANIDEKEREKINDFIENQTSSLKIIEKISEKAFLLEVLQF